MANVSIKAIRNRIKSVENTMQITRAMELVSSSKLQKAKGKAQKAQAVHDILIKTLADIRNDTGAENSPFFAESNGKNPCYIIIAGDRGLAGGYNNNLFREVLHHSGSNNINILPIGKKALEYYKSHKYNVVAEKFPITSKTSVNDCYAIADDLINKFLSGEFDRIYIAYSSFLSMLSQNPVIETLLPVPKRDSEANTNELTIYEPSLEAALDSAVHQYLSVFLYCAVCEATASEHAARCASMNAANKNASQMIDDMKLKYNRARQSVITQELTEIVAGAEAL